MRTSTKILTSLLSCLLALAPISAYSQGAMFFGGNATAAATSATFVQITPSTNAASVTANAYTTWTNTAGNTILAFVSCLSATCGGGTTSVTDTKGNTYTAKVTCNSLGTHAIRVYEADSILVGSNTLTFNSSGATFSDSYAIEVSGLAAASFDQSVCSNGSAGAVTSGSTPTTTAANELVVGWVGKDTGGAFSAIGSGYTSRGEATISNAHDLLETKNVFATGTQLADATSAGGNWWVACATFKVA